MVYFLGKYDSALGVGAVRKGSLSNSLFGRLISVDPTGVVERVSCASLVGLCWIFDGAHEQLLQARRELVIELTLYARPLLI